MIHILLSVFIAFFVSPSLVCAQLNFQQCTQNVSSTLTANTAAISTLNSQVLANTGFISTLNSYLADPVVSPTVNLVDSSGASSTTPCDVLVIAGQSNAVGTTHVMLNTSYFPGYGANYNLTSVDPRIFQFTRIGTVVPAKEPLDHGDCQVGYDARFSPWSIDIGYALLAAQMYLPNVDTGRCLLLVPAAYGGTQFGSNGGADACNIVTGSYWNPGQTGPNNLIAQTQAALQLNPGNRLIGMIWDQGESDAGVLTAQNYAHRVVNLFTYLRKQLKKSFPIVMGGLLPANDNAATYNVINGALAQVAASMFKVTFIPCTGCLSQQLTGGYTSGGVQTIHPSTDAGSEPHLSVASLLLQAPRVAAALWALVSKPDASTYTPLPDNPLVSLTVVSSSAFLDHSANYWAVTSGVGNIVGTLSAPSSPFSPYDSRGLVARFPTYSGSSTNFVFINHDYSGSNVQFGPQSNYIYITASHTMSIWIYLSNAPNWPAGACLICSHNAPWNGAVSSHQLLVTNQATISISQDNGQQQYLTSLTSALTSTTVLEQNTWHHVVKVYNSTSQTMQLYLNGVLDTTATNAPNFQGSANYVLLANFRPGDSVDQSRSTSFQYTEYFYKPAIWNYALTATQVQLLYAQQ